MKVKIALLATITVLSLLTGGVLLGRDSQKPTKQFKPTVELLTPSYARPTVEKLLELTNAERTKVGVAPLVLDERLNQSAQKKLAELELEGWDTTPHINNSGVNTANYVREAMPECYGTENLAMDYEPNPILGFRTSAAHWNALLNPRYDKVGFAIDSKYLVQHFCDLD